jgi:hypothetical protein
VLKLFVMTITSTLRVIVHLFLVSMYRKWSVASAHFRIALGVVIAYRFLNSCPSCVQYSIATLIAFSSAVFSELTKGVVSRA